MKITVVVDGRKQRAFLPYEGASHAIVDAQCPHCATAKCFPELKVSGKNMRPSADDRAWEADGYCIACGEHVGLIRTETDTLFGVEEDARIARMGIRVY